MMCRLLYNVARNSYMDDLPRSSMCLSSLERLMVVEKTLMFMVVLVGHKS